MLAMIMMTVMIAVSPAYAGSSYDVHRIAAASDRHEVTTAIEAAMGGMPDDLEYVSLIGDMVGDRADYYPTYSSSTVYDEVIGLGFERITGPDDMSILWASHDINVIDDAGIVFQDPKTDGYSGSGLMKTGYNEDGSVAYYIYGIAFNDMQDIDGADPEAEAKEFEDWVDTVADCTVPILVLCHVPLHTVRGDNPGAVWWNKALNYAATGTETDKPGEAVMRNVVFMYGHNHTVESGSDGSGREWSGEFFVPCGSTMKIGTDPRYSSRIYYTYTTAGYLKQNHTASLMTIDSEKITVEKYKDGEIRGGVYDLNSKNGGFFSDIFVRSSENSLMRVRPVTVDMPAGFTITLTDESGGSRTARGGDTVYITPGTIGAEITPPSGGYTVSGFDVTGENTDISETKEGEFRYSFGLSPEDAAIRATFAKSDIAAASVSLSGSSYRYTGSAVKPKVTVSFGGKTLKEGTDYTAVYSSNTKPGTASVTISGKGGYEGTVSRPFTIKKAVNTLTVKAKSAQVKRSKLKKKALVLKAGKVISVSDRGQGKLSYSLLSAKKAKHKKEYKRYFRVAKKSGTVRVARNLKKGTYKIKVRVGAAGSDLYEPAAKMVTFTFRVK